MRILVCGGRDFSSWSQLLYTLEYEIDPCLPKSEITIIQGGAKGADFLGKVWAEYVGANQEEYPADWKKHGYKAGPIRNKQMLEEGKPDLVIAFKGGNGTADMVRQTKLAGVELVEVY